MEIARMTNNRRQIQIMTNTIIYRIGLEQSVHSDWITCVQSG